MELKMYVTLFTCTLEEIWNALGLMNFIDLVLSFERYGSVVLEEIMRRPNRSW
jgi:hypothetical protein